MSEAPELEPCPLCNGPAEIWRASQGRTAWVACMGRCAVLVSKECTTDEEAIARWNDRTAIREAVEAARAEERAKVLDEAIAEIKAMRGPTDVPRTEKAWVYDDACERCIEIIAAIRTPDTEQEG